MVTPTLARQAELEYLEDIEVAQLKYLQLVREQEPPFYDSAGNYQETEKWLK